MSHLESVQQSFCDLFTEVYKTKLMLFVPSSIEFLNKRFIVASNNYWSATTNASNTSNAWYVYFNNGNENWNDKSNSNYVRCVRATENDKVYCV